MVDSEIHMLSNCDYSTPNVIRDSTVQQNLQKSMNDVVYRSRAIVNLAMNQAKEKSLSYKSLPDVIF